MARAREPRRRLHSLRGGDGPDLPAEAPPSHWPSFEALAPFWESFVAFARSELGTDIRAEYHQRPDGTWQFEAEHDVGAERHDVDGEPYRQRMSYDPEDDVLRFEDTRGGSWALENAFDTPTDASSAL